MSATTDSFLPSFLPVLFHDGSTFERAGEFPGRTDGPGERIPGQAARPPARGELILVVILAGY